MNKLALVCFTVYFLIILVNGQNVKKTALKHNFKVMWIKDCNSSRDYFKVLQITHPNRLQIPGYVRFNGTGVVLKTLPSNWTVSFNLKIRMPWLGWTEVPCFEECELSNMCTEEMLKECKESIVNSQLDKDKICRCDYEPGEHRIPMIKLPIDVPLLRNDKILKNAMNNAKGNDLRIDAILRSAEDRKRFGCLTGLFKMI